MVVHIQNAQKRLARLRNTTLIGVILIVLVFGGLLIASVRHTLAVASELDRRPAIGYTVYRSENTIMIMNVDLAEVYWFTDCPHLEDYTRYEEVAIYGDHENHCRDWYPLRGVLRK